MKRTLGGVVLLCLLGAGTSAFAWEVASFTPSALAPALPRAAQAVALKATQRAPLWWLRGPHREALTRGWLGVPAREQGVTARTAEPQTSVGAWVHDD